MKNQKKQAPALSLSKGFTLIEIMIASLLFSVAMIIATAVFYNTVGSRSKVEVIRDTAQSGRLAMEEITRNIRLANGAYDASGKKIVNSISIGTSPSNQFLTLWRTDPDNINNKSYKTYSRRDEDGDGIYSIYVDEGNGNKAITPPSINVTALSFTGIPDTYSPTQQPQVIISFTIQPAKASTQVISQNTITLETTVTSRDYNVQSSPGIER